MTPLSSRNLQPQTLPTPYLGHVPPSQATTQAPISTMIFQGTVGAGMAKTIAMVGMGMPNMTMDITKWVSCMPNMGMPIMGMPNITMDIAKMAMGMLSMGMMPNILMLSMAMGMTMDIDTGRIAMGMPSMGMPSMAMDLIKTAMGRSSLMMIPNMQMLNIAMAIDTDMVKIAWGMPPTEMRALGLPSMRTLNNIGMPNIQMFHQGMHMARMAIMGTHLDIMGHSAFMDRMNQHLAIPSHSTAVQPLAKATSVLNSSVATSGLDSENLCALPEPCSTSPDASQLSSSVATGELGSVNLCDEQFVALTNYYQYLDDVLSSGKAKKASPSYEPKNTPIDSVLRTVNSLHDLKNSVIEKVIDILFLDLSFNLLKFNCASLSKESYFELTCLQNVIRVAALMNEKDLEGALVLFEESFIEKEGYLFSRIECAVFCVRLFSIYHEFDEHRLNYGIKSAVILNQLINDQKSDCVIHRGDLHEIWPKLSDLILKFPHHFFAKKCEVHLSAIIDLFCNFDSENINSNKHVKFALQMARSITDKSICGRTLSAAALDLFKKGDVSGANYLASNMPASSWKDYTCSRICELSVFPKEEMSVEEAVSLSKSLFDQIADENVSYFTQKFLFDFDYISDVKELVVAREMTQSKQKASKIYWDKLGLMAEEKPSVKFTISKKSAFHRIG